VREDARFRPIADKYWNARGGSYTDGGSFIFSLKDSGDASGNNKRHQARPGCDICGDAPLLS
ncbi:MAG: hypothetical protein PHX14_11085, partial [Syntrophomonadaceae bacterium]|nr:hypothetical protein [Syntrophomonadaceae bacterium]